MKQIKTIGEQGLLKIVQKFCPSGVIGDDGAIVEVELGKSLVVTTDVLVQEVHFSDRTMTPEDVGWRAIAVNLSDLAAMGAEAIGVTVGLSVPSELEINWVEDLYRGMFACVKAYDTVILGGDLTRSPLITVGITALGQVNKDRIISRAAAQIGQAIVVTGLHGSSRGGLELLLKPEIAENLESEVKTRLIKAHQRPKPRLDCLPYLKELVKEKEKIGGMDSSDGLADALIQICKSSGVGAEIDSKKISIDEGMKEFFGKEKALEWALYGGEDFELVLTLPENLAQEFVKKVGNKAAIIGKITTEKEVKLIDKGVLLSLSQGFQHFSS